MADHQADHKPAGSAALLIIAMINRLEFGLGEALRQGADWLEQAA